MRQVFSDNIDVLYKLLNIKKKIVKNLKKKNDHFQIFL